MFPHIEKGELICAANQFTDFYMMETLLVHGKQSHHKYLKRCGSIHTSVYWLNTGMYKCYYHVRSKNRDILIYQFIYISFFSLSVLRKQLFLLLTDDLQIRKCLSNLIKSFIGS